MRTASTCIYSLICWAIACGFPRPADVPSPDADAGRDAALDAPPDMGLVSSCTADEFIACEANSARLCNSTGDGTISRDCGFAGCNADAKRCNQCAPSSDACSTVANELDHCGSDGLPAGHEACLLACNNTPAAHCAYLEPRYLADICDLATTNPDFVVSSSASIDTGMDGSCTGGVVAQTGGPDICVVRHGTIVVTASGTLTASGSRALALVADSALTIDGVLDVGANTVLSGPGGGFFASGDRPSSSDGGGGAGFATAGGNGGSAMQDGGGGHGGDRATDPSLVSVLVGGARPTRAAAGGPQSGGAGGAATLIACRGTVSVSGLIDAGGGGGLGGRPGTFSGSFFAGAGGGSGGNVVLQGLSIRVTGQVFANGGGGGAGLRGERAAATGRCVGAR